MSDGPAEPERLIQDALARLIQDAFARGRAALGAGDKPEAVRWLERARRLAPGDGTITLFLASAFIGDDNPRAAALYAEVLEAADVRDAWLGLAAARLLTGELNAARAALEAAFSRHASRPDATDLADQVVRALGSPGWCGLSGAGILIVHPAGNGKIEARIDGAAIEGDVLPPDWPRRERVTVTASGLHLIGSPISLRAIAQVDGHVEAWEGGVRGWAWHPGDPDTDPRLSIAVGRARKEIVATQPAEGISDLIPLARPRSFTVAADELPAGEARIHLRGRDGRSIPGSPVARSRAGETGPSRDNAGVDIERARRRDLKRWRAQAPGTVILVTHDDGGGVEQRIRHAVAAHAANGRRAIVLRPTKAPDGSAGIAVDGGMFPNLRFALPREQSALPAMLLGTKPIHAELHHFLNHDPTIFQIIRALGVPYDVHVHDFAWFCPRIALVGRGDRYCGEPAPDVCQTCVTETGTYLHEEIRVAALLDRSRDILFGARSVIAPSRDAADRMARHFPGLSPTVVPHSDDGALQEPPPIPLRTGTVRVCVAGAIGLHKGFHVLLACARDARTRGLDLNFVVAGTTIDDQRLIDTGKAFVTGPYQPDEAVELIRAQYAALALLPSIWPETWCLGLTELWCAGLRVAAFDIGAPAERIKQTGRGFLLPLGLAPARINDALLNAARGRSFLPIRSTSAYKPSH